MLQEASMVSALLLLPLTLFAGAGAILCPNTNPVVSKIHINTVPLDSYVTYAEYYLRVVESSRRRRGTDNSSFPHVGVVVTTDCCGRWLIDKGENYGYLNYYEPTSIDTVARPWDTMMKHEVGPWRRLRCGVVGRKKLREFLTAGLAHRRYNLFFASCFHAARRIWDTLISSQTRCC